ncbi:hypothetical protein [Streptomyces hokutonensis]|uniref:Uncharacterized protein n=1 Tax=Streptomyces hokutonensis TaxID=1306990 RepID=A0ABW6M5V6_9ACTN
MTGLHRLMTQQGAQDLINAALADPTVDLAVPLTMSLVLREGLRATALREVSRANYHPAVGEAPGSLTYRAGHRILLVTLSPESELLLSAYLDR